MATTGIKIYNLFRQDGMGYRMYLASFSTRKRLNPKDYGLPNRVGGFIKNHN